MKPRILQHGRLTPACEATLAAKFDVHPLWREADAAAFLAAHGSDFAGLVTMGGVATDRALITALPALRVISSRGVGYDRIDVDAARERGIAVANTPDVLNDCVADLAFGALLAAARNVVVADRFVRRGEWLRGRFPLSTRVSGKRLGIVGLGRIGRTVAKRASGFDLEVRYHGRRAVPDVPFRFEPALVDLARWADFLVVTVAGGAGTRGLVSAEVIEALGPAGYLVNVSRGSTVDEAALVAALVDGRLAGAALDVFEHEPRIPDALLALDNVVLLPHISSSTRETFAAMEDLVVANLDAFFTTGRVLTPVP